MSSAGTANARLKTKKTKRTRAQRGFLIAATARGHYIPALERFISRQPKSAMVIPRSGLKITSSLRLASLAGVALTWVRCAARSFCGTFLLPVAKCLRWLSSPPLCASNYTFERDWELDLTSLATFRSRSCGWSLPFTYTASASSRG
jgi:hypothetical protein